MVRRGGIFVRRRDVERFEIGKERIDEIRQVIAIAAFQNGARRDVRFAKPSTERREILRLKRHLGDRIAGVRIEARGNEQQIRLERDQLIEPAAHSGDML